MPLACSCDNDGDYDWYYTDPDDYTAFPKTRRRKRCSSCKELIEHGEQAARFGRSRPARTEIEERIYGDDGSDWEAVQLADRWLCERCADLYFSFREVGYDCISPDENMLELAKEYAETR